MSLPAPLPFTQSFLVEIPRSRVDFELARSELLLAQYAPAENTEIAAGTWRYHPLRPGGAADTSREIEARFKMEGSHTRFSLVIRGAASTEEARKLVELFRDRIREAAKNLKPLPERAPSAPIPTLDLKPGRKYQSLIPLTGEDSREIAAGSTLSYQGTHHIPYDMVTLYTFCTSDGRKWCFEGSLQILAQSLRPMGAEID